MKAVIMAGGEGTRLRPLTERAPKPMLRLLDRPVLEHIIALLRENGFNDICLTLKYMPDAITSYFGGGEDFGVRLQSRTEKEPLGTAGGVRACADFIGNESVLVMSGDCVCDFDLAACVDFHEKSGAEATVVLYSHPDPTEYGAVVTGARGRVESFCEKPSWESVVTGDVSTGIYILSPETVRSIPENTPFDFGRDLFPRLLREGRGLFAVRAGGYWCDIGSPEAYLRCCADALSGAVRLSTAAPKVRGGVWSASFLPAGAVAAPPVYIGENALIEPGARLGPNAVVGSGSRVCRAAEIKNSVLDGAVVKAGASLDGAIAGEGCVVGEDAVLCPGSVLGSGASVGKGAVISERVRVSGECAVPDGERVAESIAGGMPKAGPAFSFRGVMRGPFGLLLTPERCLAIGSAAAAFGSAAVAHDGTPAASALAGALCCGVLAAGGRAVRLDAPFQAAAAFGGALYGLPTTVFVSCPENDAELDLFGSDCLPVTRASERRFEAALRGETKRVPAHAVGESERVSGVCDALAAIAAAEYGGGSAAVTVSGRGAADRALRTALRSSGCAVMSEARRRVPAFSSSGDGFSLSAVCEDGASLGREQMLLLTALAAFSSGISEIAAPLSAPAALERLAAMKGGRVLRLERDGGAAALWKKQPFMRFAAFAAPLILRVMRNNGAALSDLRNALPNFATAAREVPVIRPRGDVMDAVRGACAEMALDLTDGFSASVGDGGRVSVSPCRRREAVIIRAEGETEEIAEELCADFEKRVKALDRRQQPLPSSPRGGRK